MKDNTDKSSATLSKNGIEIALQYRKNMGEPLIRMILIYIYSFFAYKYYIEFQNKHGTLLRYSLNFKNMTKGNQ